VWFGGGVGDAAWQMANAGEVSLVLSGKGYAEDRDIDQRVG
jgi:hypothetical protein